MAGIFRMSVFSVTLTVITFLVARSFSVTLPALASTLISSPERFLNEPLTTCSAWTVKPSGDLVPRA